MIWALLAGLICGFVGSIPIAGPIAVIVIERTLKGESKAAFEIALGASVVEAAYALCAYLGMTAFLSRFPWLIPVSRVLGAAILLALGLYLALRKPTAPADPAEAAAREPAKRTFGAMFFLGVVVSGVNPTLLASWSAVVTALHSTGTLRVVPLDAFPFALGVGVGIAAWFGMCVALLSHFRRKVSERTMDRVVRGIGAAIVVAGIVVTVQVVRGFLRGT